MKPITVLIIAIGVGALAFFCGMQYQQSKQSSGRNMVTGQFGGVGRTGTGARRIGNGATLGDIINMDSSSITVKLIDGSSRIVLFSDKTVYNKTAPVDKSELKVGGKVSVFGTTNTDGSITAQNVQLNPQIRAGAGAGSSPATGSAR